MSLMPSNKEKLRNEWEKIKSLKGKELREYIWEYYKLYIIVVLIILAVIGNSIYRSAVNPPLTPMLNIAWNYGPQLPDFYMDLADELTSHLEASVKNERVFIIPFFETDDPQMNMAMQMRLAAMVSTGEVDIVIATEDELGLLADEFILLDISSWLPAGTGGLLKTEYENGTSIVYGVSIRESRMLKNASFFITDGDPNPYLGVFINTAREKNVRQTIELLLR